MHETPENTYLSGWVTLKEAARMLGCSVKTIRRRIEAGKLKSMVEYHGNRAIRMVSRDDVLEEAPPLDALLPPGVIPESIKAFRDDIPTSFEVSLRSSLSDFGKRAEGRWRMIRLYILIGIGILLISFSAFFIFTGTQSNILSNQVEKFQNMVITKLEIESIVGRNDSKTAQKNAQVSRVLNEASLQELEATRTEVTTLRREVGYLENQLAELQKLLISLKDQQNEGTARFEKILNERLPAPSPIEIPPSLEDLSESDNQYED